MLQPVTLEGERIKLEPLREEHLDALCKVGLDESLWKWTPKPVITEEDMRQYIRLALTWQHEGTALPFVIIEKSTARIVGSTRFANIDMEHRRLEIGWTWIGQQWQRTPTNTEAKYLLLQHAFETLGCIRVEFKTDSLNDRSRKAILRLGAIEEGTLRNHMITTSGRIRHTVYYGIIASDWPEIKQQLQNKFNPHSSAPKAP